MKKLILSLLILGFVTAAQAQKEPILKSKKGHYILPQTGDWAIGISANTFLNYAGNLFSNNNNAPDFSFFDQNNTVFGKKFVSENFAYRGSLSMLYGNSTENVFVKDLAPGAASDATVTDKINAQNFEMILRGGVEYRRGSGRLQGVYGGYAQVGFSSGSTSSRTYGNTMENYRSVALSRQTEYKEGTGMNFGLFGFAGVEYFFAPRISIGGEFNLGALYYMEGKTTRTEEVWNNSTSSAEILKKDVQANSSEFNISTDNLGGVLKLMFHF